MLLEAPAVCRTCEILTSKRPRSVFGTRTVLAISVLKFETTTGPASLPFESLLAQQPAFAKKSRLQVVVEAW